jgi:hypothetical protein
MTANWTPERFAALQQAFLDKMRESGTIRTHRANDEPPKLGRPKAQAGAVAAKPPRRLPKAAPKPRIPESAVLRAVAQLLSVHPQVALHWRQNTGATRFDGRFVRFGHPGLSDYLGLLQDGRLLAVECKASYGKLTPEQATFLEAVASAGGFAWWGSDASALKAALDAA